MKDGGIKERVTNLKGFAVKKTLNGMVFALPMFSEDFLLARAERYVSNLNYPEAQEFVRALILQVKRRFPRLHRNTRRGAVNFIVNALFYKEPLRDAFQEKNGFSPPILLVISPTMRCNLACEGCYAGMYERKEDLPPEVFDRVLTEAEEMGIYFMVISGGEPLLYEPLMDTVTKHPDLTFMMYTNGTLIDKKTAERIAELGNLMPCISVEGYEEETDRRRGKGVYAKVNRAMDNLRDAGALFGFSATATRFNNELLVSEEFIDHYIGKGCFIGWYFQYMPVGTEPSLELMTTPEQREYRRREVNRLRRDKQILLSDFWNDGPLVGGCLSGGRSYLHINCRGDVEPCVFAHFSVDNIKRKPLKEVLNSPFFRAIRERQPFSDNLLRPCMIIDHPHILRELVTAHAAFPTHPEAEGIITKLADALDQYGAAYGAIADPVWEREYAPRRAASEGPTIA